MVHFFKGFLTLILISTVAGCSTLSTSPSSQQIGNDKPDFESYESYYFWGLHGEEVVNTQQICGSRPVSQLQTLYTFEDILFNVFSLGIYSPQTYRVWCGAQKESQQ